MPRIVADLVDVYVFRRLPQRPAHGVQFLLLRRREDAPLGGTWHAVHGRILPNERALDAAARELLEQTGLVPQKLYSADYIAQFYDHASDAIVLAPAFAALVEPRAAVRLSQAHDDYAWCDLDEAVARLLWTSQRWAVRHIHAVIACGGEEAEYYALT
jgi:dATP pyrophosphohydrolase